MATFDNAEWKRRQDAAAAREFAYARQEIAILENILGEPASNVPDDQVYSRLADLRAQVRTDDLPDEVVNALVAVFEDKEYTLYLESLRNNPKSWDGG